MEEEEEGGCDDVRNTPTHETRRWDEEGGESEDDVSEEYTDNQALLPERPPEQSHG